MEDFIIILIGFALMIYSAYSKNKKAKQNRGQQSSAESDSSGEPASESEASEDILEQFFGYEPKQEESHPFQQSDSEERDNVQQSDKGTANKNWQDMARESLKDRKERPQQQSRNKQGTTPSSSHVKRRNASAGNKYQHWFNLRNAVIYSEIMNRKY